MIKNAYQFLISDSMDARTIKIIRAAFFGGSLVLFCWFVYFSLLTIVIPYQIEYREGAAQVMTQILLKGGNPFSSEYQPLGMNNYGIAYNLLVFPFAKLFGNTLTVHRAISFVALLASFLLVVKTGFLLKKDVLISILCGVFIVVVLAGRGSLGAFPSAMGSFLFLSGLLIPLIYSFSYPGLIASALLSIIAYYTKPYFVVCFIVVAVYTFVFVSKKKGVIFGLLFLSAFGLLFLAVRLRLEFYFIDTFIGNISNTNRSVTHLLQQLIELCAEFFPSILLGISFLLWHGSIFPHKKILQTGFRPHLNFLRMQRPLLDLPVNYLAFTFVVCFLMFISVLGLHTGSYLTSAYQIVFPPFILWLIQKPPSKSWLSIISLGLLFSNILILEVILLNPSYLRQRDSVAWNDLYDHIKDSQQVVNSPAVVSALIEAGVLPVDSGQTEYYYNIKPYSNMIVLGPDYDTVKSRGIAYRRSIRNAIGKGKFDKLILTDGYGNLVSFDVVKQYYARVERITIDMPQTNQTWVIGIWEPIGK